MEDYEWSAKSDSEKLDWLRKQSDELATLMVSNFETLKAYCTALQAEQKRLAEALEDETRRSKRAARR